MSFEQMYGTKPPDGTENESFWEWAARRDAEKKQAAIDGEKVNSLSLKERLKNFSKDYTGGKGENRMQRIVIYYRLVGYVEIPEVVRRPNIVADTRKCVSIKYLKEPKTA